MKSDKLIDAIGMIDDRYIEEAHSHKKNKTAVRFNWGLAGKIAAAACALLLLINVFPTFFHSYKSADKQESAYYYNSGSSQMAYDSAPAAAEEPSYEEYAEAEEAKPSAMGDENIDIRQNKKLILTSYMTMETQEMDDLMEKITALVSSYGGYFQRSSLSNRGNQARCYDATIRIPAQSYSAFLEELRGEGNALYYSEETKDITDTYTDIEARLNSLKAQEAKVLEFYDRAETLEDLMSVEARLSDIRYEIEYYETQIKNYDLLVAYSTLNLTVNETKVYTPVNTSFFSRLARSFVGGWNSFIDGIGDFIIDIVYNIWTILLLAGLGYGGYAIYRKIRNRKKA